VFAGGCKKPWPKQADKVKLGMSRAEVEQLLPRHEDSPVYIRFTYTKTDQHQKVTYWLDEYTKVTIRYDYTDTEPFLSGGMATVFDASAAMPKGAHPNNKVVQLPELSEEDMPKNESGAFYSYDFGIPEPENNKK